MKYLQCLVCVLFIASVCSTNMASQTFARLVPSEPSVVQSQWRHPIISPVRCDDDGNVYIREYVPGTTNDVVTIIGSEGDKVTDTSLDSDPTLKKGKLQDFGIGPGGDLYELVQVGRGAYLVNFKRDGSLSGAVKLDKEFWPAKLAIGEATGALFLVSGTENPVPGEPPKLFTGLFDANGKLIREVNFPGDPGQIKAEKQKAGSSKNYYEDKSSVPLQLGTAEADSNGNFYLIRASEPPVVFVLDPSGKFVRKLEIKAPYPGMRLLAAHVSSGRLAALFGQVKSDGQIVKKVMTIVDTSNGDIVQQYSVPSDLGSAFACYSGSDFGFVTTKDNKLAIQYAHPG
jgi:hypothetical protein